MFSAEDFIFQGTDPIRCAILLAMSSTKEEEADLITRFRENGLRCAATMAYGHNSVIKEKIVANVIGMCLNAGIVERKRSHIHPVAHAIQEACYSSKLGMDISQNCRFKVAAACFENQFALAIYGDLAIHELSSHKTIGIGFQILGE